MNRLRQHFPRGPLALALALAFCLLACSPAGRPPERALPADVQGFPGLTPDEVGRWRLDEEAVRERATSLDRLAALLELAPGTRVADVGAGGGFHMVRLAPRVGAAGRYHAVDVDPRALELLRWRLGRADLPQADVVASRPDDVALPPESLDVAFLSETWHVVAHQPTAPALMASIRRALRPGGLLAVLETKHAEWVNPRTGAREPNLRYVDPEEAARRLESFGFRLESREDLPEEYLLKLRRL